MFTTNEPLVKFFTKKILLFSKWCHICNMTAVDCMWPDRGYCFIVGKNNLLALR